MPIIKYFKRLQYINYMIKNKGTGTLEAFARKNNVSKTTLSEILNEMKEMGFPIKYDRCRKTYYYEEHGEMIKCLFMRYGEVANREELREIGAVDKLCFSPRAIFELCKD